MKTPALISRLVMREEAADDFLSEGAGAFVLDVDRWRLEDRGWRFPGLCLLPQPPRCCLQQPHGKQTQSHHPTPSSLHFPSLTSQPPDYLSFHSRGIESPAGDAPHLLQKTSPHPTSPLQLVPIPVGTQRGAAPPQTHRQFSCSSVLRTAAGEAPSAPTLPFHSPAGFSLPLLGNPATNPAPKPLLMPAENHGPIPALPAPLSRGRPRSSLGPRRPLPGPRSPRADILLLAQLFPQLGSDVSVSGSCRNRRRRLDGSFVIFLKEKIWVWSVPHWFREKPPFRAGVEGEPGSRARSPASGEGPGIGRITEVEG